MASTLKPPTSAQTTFNGGTISAPPVTILETDGTSKGLIINTQGGSGVYAVEVDAPHTTLTVDGDGFIHYLSDDTPAFLIEGTNNTPAQLSLKDGTSGNLTQLQTNTGLTVSDTGGVCTITLESNGATAAQFANDGLGNAWLLTNPPAAATATLSSGTGAALSTTQDVHSYTPVTFNPTAGAAATCAVAISKNGTNYTALWTETEPAGVALDGAIHGINVDVPAGWKLKLTVTNGTIGTTTYY